MGLFSFGGNKSKTVSESSSFDRSSSGGVSGGFGVSGSESEQRIAFEDTFARLFGGAEGAAAGLDPSMLTEAANTLFSGGTDFMAGIGGDAGSQYLTDRLSGENEVLQQQIDLLGEDLGSFFADELNPAITSEAVAGHALGGGRQGVAQSGAIDAVSEQFTRGATALRAGDIAARDAAAGTVAGNAITGASVGMQAIPGLAGIANMGFSADIAPYERLAAILGGPTTLTSAASASTSADFARNFSESYGESRATSTSKSKGLKLGFI